jgi:hypothetical protein
MFQFQFLLSMLVVFASSMSFAKVPRPPQFVLLAFDGSKSLSFWRESRQFAASHNVDFTYFISGVYFLSDTNRKNYVEPSRGAGQSAIGFGGVTADIQSRVEQVRLASEEGHEMASHANSHYDGAKYTEQQWDSENSQFTSLMIDAWKNNGVEKNQPSWWRGYFGQTLSNDPGMVGFRAPLLGVGNGLWKSLKNNGILYDTSRVDKMGYWPKQINGIWNFPLASLTIVGSGKKTLSMDYNFYVADSKGVAGPKTEHAAYEERMVKTYLAYFENNYFGNRAPVHIGHHFSLWNGGAYWRAMQRFAKAVCSRPEVVCGTYKELLAYMEKNKNSVEDLQAGDFDRLASSMKRQQPIMKELTDKEIEELRATLPNHFNAHDEEAP